MGEKRFQGDETRGEVFADVEGKTSHRWYLWVTQSASVVFSRMAPGRWLCRKFCSGDHEEAVAPVCGED
jgi:hypothetical protein